MREAKFEIGDRVRGTNIRGSEGVVVDAFVSKASGWRYEISTDRGVTFFIEEEELAPVEKGKDYSMTIKIDIAQNVVIATLFEIEGDATRPLAKGHGHLIREGATGIAQAASYACKRLYENMGGTISKGGSWK